MTVNYMTVVNYIHVWHAASELQRVIFVTRCGKQVDTLTRIRPTDQLADDGLPIPHSVAFPDVAHCN